MDLYTVSLATGAVGLGIMAVGGLSHGAHAGLDANGNGRGAPELFAPHAQLHGARAAAKPARAVRLRSGDLVWIAKVDAERGRCTVTQPTRKALRRPLQYPYVPNIVS